MNEFKGQSIDAVLRELFKQSRLDAGGAEKLAGQGIDRLRTFLAGDQAAAPTTTTGTTTGTTTTGSTTTDGTGPVEAGIVQEPAVLAEAEVVPERSLEHTVPLRGGRSARVVVPEGFTRADADRIAGVLAALALDPEDPAGAGR